MLHTFCIPSLRGLRVLVFGHFIQNKSYWSDNWIHKGPSKSCNQTGYANKSTAILFALWTNLEAVAYTIPCITIETHPYPNIFAMKWFEGFNRSLHALHCVHAKGVKKKKVLNKILYVLWNGLVSPRSNPNTQPISFSACDISNLKKTNFCSNL